jgi:hypothetical protein
MAERLVFVSYGLLTDEERRFGDQVAATIRAHEMKPFIAQEVHSANDLNSNVFEAVRMCDAFLGILQKRGTVTFRGYPGTERSSVWIQQEFAIFCYRAFVERRTIPMRIYAEHGIRREGVMEIAMANPIEFDDPDEVIADVAKWLDGPDFADDPVAARREAIFKRRFERTNEDERLLLELVAAHCPQAGDYVPSHTVRDDFYEVWRAVRVPDEQIEKRYKEAYARVRSFGLAANQEDKTTGNPRVWIPKQWFQLLQDEFRRLGRRL